MSVQTMEEPQGTGTTPAWSFTANWKPRNADGDGDWCEIGSAPRFRRLAARFESVREAFVDLDELIADFLRTAPAGTDLDPAGDGQRFLAWLCSSYGLTAEQQEALTVRRAVAGETTTH